MNKEKMKKWLKEKEDKRSALIKRAEESQDVTELRKIHEELTQLNEEITELKSMIDDETDERTGAVNSAIPGIVVAGSDRRTAQEPDMEYRQAFFDYVMRGQELPEELRADQISSTTDLGIAIPTVLVDQILEKMETYGHIYQRVTHMSYPAGVKIPTSNVKPVASWVAEGKGSDKQKKSITGYISFSWNKLRCAVAVTLEAGIVSISAFEKRIVEDIARAMVKAIEEAIFNGDGQGKPKGFLTETPATGQALTAAKPSYESLIDAEAALPGEYEAGTVWLMAKKTFMKYFGIVDQNGQPIARVDHGITGAPVRVLLGREVIFTDGYMDTYSDTLAAGKIYAALFNLADYGLNISYNMGIREYVDEETEDTIRKSVMLADGKTIDKNSLVTIAVPTTADEGGGT